MTECINEICFQTPGNQLFNQIIEIIDFLQDENTKPERPYHEKGFVDYKIEDCGDGTSTFSISFKKDNATYQLISGLKDGKRYFQISTNNQEFQDMNDDEIEKILKIISDIIHPENKVTDNLFKAMS